MSLDIVILSGVRSSRSEVVAQSKDPLLMNTKMNLKRHFHHDGAGRTTLHAIADFELHGLPFGFAQGRLSTPR
jgi:hypothetical protein